jgi:geranylgeranyl reductase family protein
MQDVIVAGGGPGGLYAATRLASAGLRVTVLEEHPRAGEPVHCTGVLAVEAFDEFELPRTSVLNALNTATFIGPSGASFSYTTPRTEAVVIDRLEFDRMLLARAEASGAAVRTGVRVTDVAVDRESVSVALSDGRSITGRVCVLACGANYTLQRRLGLGAARRHLQSAQLELPAATPRDTEVYFGSEVAPEGFAWAVPVERGGLRFARIGLMCRRDARTYFARFLARVAPHWGIDLDRQASEPRSKVLPLGPIAQTYADRLLAVGDAAGLVKPTTGGGIYYSLLSGRLAADVLARALAVDDLRAGSLGRYEQLWREALGPELDAQTTLREIASAMDDEAIDSLFELARTNGVIPILRRTAAFNRHRNLILSLLAHPPVRRILMRRALGWTTGPDASV